LNNSFRILSLLSLPQRNLQYNNQELRFNRGRVRFLFHYKEILLDHWEIEQNHLLRIFILEDDINLMIQPLNNP